MARVIWLTNALDDLAEIRAFIMQDSPEIAELIVERIVQVAERLEQFPRSGRIVPELGDADIRELLVQNYRIVYRIRSEDVEVVMVHHGARRFPTDAP